MLPSDLAYSFSETWIDATKTNAKIPNDLTKLAESLGLNMQEFEACINSEKYPSEIRKDQAQGREAGIRGTPTFYFGLTILFTLNLMTSIGGQSPFLSASYFRERREVR